MSSSEKIDRTHSFESDDTILPNWWDNGIKVHKVNYIWSIHYFHQSKADLPKGQFLKSPIFSGEEPDDGCKWRLIFYPNGTKNSSKDDSSLFLVLHDSSEHTNVFGEYEFTILNENQNEAKVCCRSEKIRKFESTGLNQSWGISDFIKNDYEVLSNSNNAHELIIYCKLTFSLVDPRTNTFDQYIVTKLESNIKKLRSSEDLNTECFYVSLSTKDKDYKAHKTILIAHSPIFADMLKKENQQNKIDMTDFDEKIVKEMLNYIYTGKSENLENLADGLLAVAEKYSLFGLKELCEISLIENLSVENAMNMMKLADLHHAHGLKSNTIQYILANYQEVIDKIDLNSIEASNIKSILDVWKVLFENCTPLYPYGIILSPL